MTLRQTLILGAVVSAIGGFLFGFDTAVISGAEQHLEKIFVPASGLSAWWAKFWHGFLMASALIGTVVGSVVIGKPADRFGRRFVLFWIAVLYFISAFGTGLAWDWYSFVFFRFVGGLGIGAASVVCPMYIAEISPARYRGRLVALTQFNVVLGILCAFLSNYAIAAMALGETEWRWMFGVAAIPSALFYLLLFLTPRSPRWLMAQGREDEARAVLNLVGVDENSGGVEIELRQIRDSLDLDRQNLNEPLFQRKYFTPIMMAFLIAAFNQLSGINAILYYSKRIFESAGFGAQAGLLNSVGLGIVNLVFTMIGVSLIDNIGRRKLMIIGSLGYLASLSLTAWAFFTQSTTAGFSELGSKVVLISLLGFIAAHAIGSGTVIWVFIGEIFPNRVRARGQALGSFTHWIFAAVISQSFPLIAEKSGAVAFLFYDVCMAIQLIWVLTKMPETKGIPLEEIQKRLGIE